jgi:hypothetical protein
MYTGGGNLGAGTGSGTTLGVNTTGAGGTSLSNAPGTTNIGGAIAGGLGGAAGLLNLIQGFQGGNPQQGIGGGLQSIGGLAALLRNSPELAHSLGLTPEMLGAVGVGGAGWAVCSGYMAASRNSSMVMQSAARSGSAVAP